jgi:glycogen operon protein
VEKNADLVRFFGNRIAFRREHPALRRTEHPTGRDIVGSGYPDISFHGTSAWNADWSPWSRTLAFMLCGKHAEKHGGSDDYIYVAMNTHWDDHGFELPGLPDGRHWHVSANTAMPSPDDCFEHGVEPRVADQGLFLVGARSVVVLVGR